MDSGAARDDRGWQTEVSEMEGDFATLYGYPVDELAGQRTFTEGIYLAFTGELPTERQRGLLDRVLLLSIAHGVAPSGAVARALVACGSPIQAVLAGSSLTFGDVHGGAGEALAKYLHEDALPALKHQDREEVSTAIVDHFTSESGRLPGFGHPLHTDGDPRARFLLDSAREFGVAGAACGLLEAVEERLAERLGRRIPMNVDGALVGITLDLDIDWRFSRPLMVLARLPTLSALAIEEVRTPSRGWRSLVVTGEHYNGPPRRTVPPA